MKNPSKRFDSLGRVHCDASRKDKGFFAEETPEGFLRVTGRLTRVGVFRYEDEQGNSWGEYRSEKEVFSPESLASFQMVILTDDHPAEMISAKNVSDYQVGHVGTDVVRDGLYIVATILVTDSAVIAAIRAGKVELSCGYFTVVIDEPGTSPEGWPYDRVQTEIRGNHLALVDEGRAGPTCRLVLDARAARSVSEDTMNKRIAKKKDKAATALKADAKVWVGDVEFEVPEEVAKEWERMKGELEAEESEEAPMSPASSAGDMEAEMAPMDADMEMEVEDPEMMDAGCEDPMMDSKAAKVTDHASIVKTIALLDSAKAVLGSVKADASPDSIKRSVIYKVLPSLKGSFDSAKGPALDGAFEVAMAAYKKNSDSKAAFAKGAFDAASTVKSDSAVSAYDDLVTRRNNKGGNR